MCRDNAVITWGFWIRQVYCFKNCTEAGMVLVVAYGRSRFLATKMNGCALHRVAIISSSLKNLKPWQVNRFYLLLYFVPLFFLFAVTTTQGQSVIDWVTLGDVTFSKLYSEEMMLEYDTASYGSVVQQYDGKEVQISGYVIPLDAMGISFVLSRNPNATCFFCGGGGPETIVDIKVKPTAFRRYQMDQRMTFKGILKLYPDNSKSFIYVLTEAEPI